MSGTSRSKFQSFLAAKNIAIEPQQSEETEAARARPAQKDRSIGKRSDPAYEQVTAYIRKRTHDAVKLALLKEGKRRQFSELVEELLSTWTEKAE